MFATIPQKKTHTDGATLGLGKIRAMSEEPPMVFPIPETDRALDQLRCALQASPCNA